MANEKRRMTEVLLALDTYSCEECQKCDSHKYGLPCDDRCFAEKTAEYLIANGVTVPEWISVKDRLPEKNGEYLCRHTDKSVHSAEYESIYGSFGYWFDFWEDEYKEWVAFEGVTHWMPLPQPPKGE